MKLIMQHPNTGIIKKVGVGFSWALFFFGGLVPLFRGNIKECFRFLFLNIICFHIYGLVYSFIGNKRYTIQLLEKGFKVKEVQGGTIEEARQKLGIALPVLES